MSGDVRSRHSRRVLACVLLAVAAATGFVAWRVAPWSSAAPVPVQLWLDAPAETSIRLSWDSEKSADVPFVPQMERGQRSAALWLAELPPRPEYRLSITFTGAVRHAVLKELILVDVRHLEEPLLRLSAAEIRQEFTSDKVELVSADGEMHLNCPATGSLSHSAPVPTSPAAIGARFGSVWLFFSATVLFVVLVVAAFFRQARTARPLAAGRHRDRIARPLLAPLWIAFGLGLGFHLSVTASLPALYNPYDPLHYFQKAVALAEAGTYTTNTPAWEIDRLPGYPLFLAICIKLFGYHLKAVTLSQGLLFGMALLALAVSLRHWIPTWYTAAAVLVLLVSPAGLQHTLAIGTEGLFAALAAFALAAFFEHLGTEEGAARLWLAVFGVVTTAAVFVRPNAIVLLAAPIAAWFPAAIQAARTAESWTGRIHGVARCTLRYSLPMAFLAISLGSWALRNFREHGMLVPTSMVGICRVEGLTQSGTFDARSLMPESLYREYLLGKSRGDYGYCGWNIRAALYDQLTQQQTRVPADIIAVLDRRMQGIAARSQALVPWELKVGGVIRSAWWGFELPAEFSYKRNIIWQAPRYFGNHPQATATWKEFCEVEAPAQIGKRLPLVDLEDQELATQWPLPFIQSKTWGKWHQRGYRIFLIAGLIGGVLMLWSGTPALAAPTLVFLANLALNAWLQNVLGRYILTLESLVVFQTVMGLHLLIRYLRELDRAPSRKLCQRRGTPLQAA